MSLRKPIDTVKQGEARARANIDTPFARCISSEARDAWTEVTGVAAEQLICRQEVWLFRIRR